MKTNQPGLDLIIDAAKADFRPEEQFTTHLRRLWTLLTPAQRLMYLGCADVATALEAIDEGDRYATEFDALAAEAQNTTFAGAASLLDEIICRHPGFANDGEVNGGDLVEFISERIAAAYPTLQAQS
ncbi:hypothetical protein [Burkholderia sp. Ac-20365]|uniref:hypothetical protein n=1 Tax=Burkholderia sp. Ac-20365 TaxID=2703897 RepID=UPI00197C7A7E|nr:hypothetical protein [Burkholderia sp. Ac-20365]MBN3760901.1 hypothetical protein [Burkholderia sp. Ac-20365]